MRFHYDAIFPSDVPSSQFVKNANLPQLIEQVFTGFHVGVMSLGVEGDHQRLAHHHNHQAGQQGHSTLVERQKSLAKIYKYFRKTLGEAHEEFSVSFAFCFLGLYDNKIIDIATNEIIPGK